MVPKEVKTFFTWCAVWPLQVDIVHRFVVVHGQIILNQFRNFPNKEVQRAAFVGALKGHLEQRRHSKVRTRVSL
jgi:hypothetical protein